MIVLSLLLFFVFLALSGIHLYWAAGGTYGFKTALPTKETGELAMNPTKNDSIMMGAWLFTFGSYYLMRSGLLPLSLPDWVHSYVGWAIPAIFLLRAMGEFRYVGFFKRIKNTPFAKKDSQFFSPLCLFLAIVGFWIQWMTL